MNLSTRKLLDKSFSGLGLSSIALMGITLILILAPIIWNGSKAYIFKGTIEHRKVMFDHFDRGNYDKLAIEKSNINTARNFIYQSLDNFDEELKLMDSSEKEENIDQNTENSKNKLKNY